jgi:universal stress protein A
MNDSIQRILFPTDFSESARQAQDYACSMASKFAAELHVLHVVSDPAPLPPITGFPTSLQNDPLPQIIRDAENHLSNQLEDALKKISRALRVVRVVRAGDAVPQIIDYAQSHEIDLIILGTHGRTGLSQLLIGSVAEKVVRLAACPVMTIHPRNHRFLMDRPENK